MQFYESPLPAVGEIVAVKVEAIHEYGVSVQLLEYNVAGLVMASELSRRRIRTIKEVVRVGQETAATVVKADATSMTVDLSIKVCTPDEIASVLTAYHKHKTIHNILTRVAELTGTTVEHHYKNLIWPMVCDGKDVYEQFVSLNNPETDDASVLGVDNPQKEEFKKLAAQRLPKPSFTLTVNHTLKCSDSLNASEKLTDALNAAAAAGAEVWIIAPPSYRFVVTAGKKDEAESILAEAKTAAEKALLCV